MPSALHYADWLVRYYVEELGAPIDAMSLEKQLYYAQGFYLAINGNELFPEEFQAWKKGPVIGTVWNCYSGSSITRVRRSLFAPKTQPAIEEQFFRESVGFFAALSAFDLSKATHLEEPWLNARAGLSDGEASNRLIDKRVIRRYYASLMADGEEALSNYALLGTVPEPRWGWLYVAGICARRMVIHPMFVKGLSLWGPGRKLWERPTAETFSDDLYPSPSEETRSRSDVLQTDDEESFRAEYRRMMS